MGDQMPPEKECPDCGGAGENEWQTPTGEREWISCSGCMGTGTVVA